MAKDDPIIGEQSIDYDICRKNPYVLLGVTERGGHLGYFESLLSTK
jgi:predicted alpha/beta-fold hydrolase